MDSNFSGNPDKRGSGQGQTQNVSILVLHNDDVNTFEFVMGALEEVCAHTVLQAEQCAMITHYKGKCEILKGEISELKLVRNELVSRGLSATIE
ncbi:MAG: ATP-dependent Clp protease adaptor ClpS [Bacteroidales bacterium]|nr:ATP-dependent Clp protease adaptor ClpS [Bacteroidales bacterium]